VNGGGGSYYHGVDVSTATSLSAVQCMMSNGYTSIIARAYTNGNSVDTAACTTLNNAKQAGMPTRGAYLFPCPTCGNPQQQVKNTVSYLNNNCAASWGNTLWLYIEGPQYWSTSVSTNQVFFQGLLDQCDALGVVCGVYSSQSQWNPIFGSSYTYAAGLGKSLWYAHYESPAQPNFNDFVAFGGWVKPYAKQYQGTTSFCGASVDLNVYGLH